MKVAVKYGMDPAASIELLADSSILPTGRPLFVPDWAHTFMATISIAARINRLGKCIAPRFAHRYWDAATACLLTQGIDEHGNAITRQALSRAHDGALIQGQMLPKEVISEATQVTCLVNGTQVTQVTLQGLARLIDDTIVLMSQYMTLKMGDLVCITSPSKQPLLTDSTIELVLNEQEVLKTKIK